MPLQLIPPGQLKPLPNWRKMLDWSSESLTSSSSWLENRPPQEISNSCWLFKLTWHWNRCSTEPRHRQCSGRRFSVEIGNKNYFNGVFVTVIQWKRREPDYSPFRGLFDWERPCLEGTVSQASAFLMEWPIRKERFCHSIFLRKDIGD